MAMSYNDKQEYIKVCCELEERLGTPEERCLTKRDITDQPMKKYNVNIEWIVSRVKNYRYNGCGFS